MQRQGTAEGRPTVVFLAMARTQTILIGTFHRRTSLVPAPAVIPAPKAYTDAVAPKALVV